MRWFLYFISLFWVAIGCCMILYTGETRRVFKNMIKTTDRKFLWLLPFITGLLLLFAASASHYPGFIRFIGIIAVIKSGFIFFNPEDLWQKLTTWYLNAMSDQACRLSGIITIILGTAVLSWIV
jgi:uncharacterized protein YjeT (DUF2065 family)